MINDAEAEKTFKTGSYYKHIGKVASAEYYFGKIPSAGPTAPGPSRPRSSWLQLAKMPRTPSKPSKIIIPPGSTDPFGGGGMGGMGMGGMAAWAAWAWAAWAWVAWAWAAWVA